MCGDVTDTIVIALTNKDKIFGGFTPFCFWNGKDEWVSDPKRKSFLFSISSDYRLELDDIKFAIHRYATNDKCINFGNSFKIFDKANTNTDCLVGHSSHYRHPVLTNDK